MTVYLAESIEQVFAPVRRVRRFQKLFTVRTIWTVRTVRCSHCSLFAPNSANEWTANTFVRSSMDPGTSKVSFRNFIIIWQYLRSKINPSFITLNTSGMSIINRLSVDFVIKCDVLKVPVWVLSWSLQIRKWMKRLLVLFKNVTPDVQNFPFFQKLSDDSTFASTLILKRLNPSSKFSQFSLVNQYPLILTELYFKTIYYIATQWRVNNRLIFKR